MAQTAIAGLGNIAADAGNKASTASGGLYDFAAAAEIARQAAMGNILAGLNVQNVENQVNAIANAYKPQFNAIQSVSVKPSGGSNKSSGGGRSSKDTWKEAYDQARADLDHRYKMELLSTQKFYDELAA